MCEALTRGDEHLGLYLKQSALLTLHRSTFALTIMSTPPTTRLGRHRQLCPTAGVHVSPIQLGAMSIGDAWSDGLGAMDKESSFRLLDAYYKFGGNFIDTANV